MKSILQKARGFTLLEVMIAIAIFAIIGLGCWQVLDRVITSKQQLEARSTQLAQLQKALWLISRDMRNIIDRPIRDESGLQQAAVSSLVGGYSLSFTRGGWQNPLHQTRSNLQRVAYALEPDPNPEHNGNNQLVRYFWPRLDRGPNAEPNKQILLDQAQFFEVQFIDSQGGMQFHWPVTTENIDSPANLPKENLPKENNIAPLPSGILLRLDVPPFGEIERLFALRDIEATP